MASTAFVLYALTGALATALHVGLLLLLVEGLHWPPASAAALAALAGAAFAYAGNRRYSFALHTTRHAARHGQALPRFAVVALLSALLNGAIVWLGTTRLGLHYLLAQALATLTGLLLGYRLNKTWSFA